MKIWFFTGKGGVGKSTLSATAAWQLSRKGKVLIVSLDPAHNLGDIFGVRLNDKENRFSKTLFLKEVNIAKLTRQYLEREMKVLSETYRYTSIFNLDHYFSLLQYSPGVEEYALLTAIEMMVRERGDYEHMVFDTPPTGLTLRFLALPRITNLWLDRLLRLRRKILERRHTIGKVRGVSDEEQAAREQILAYEEGDDPVLRRLLGLEVRYRELVERLQGANTTFCVVFNPDPLSLRESERLIRSLQDLGLPPRLLIGNKLTPDNRILAEKTGNQLKRLAPKARLEWVPYTHGLHADKGASLYDVPVDLATALQG